MKVGAFADSCRQPQSPLDPDLDIPSVPFSSLLAPHQQSPPQPSVQPTEPPVETGGGTETEDDGNGNVTPRCDSRRSSCSLLSTNEDFIMVDLVIICSCNNMHGICNVNNSIPNLNIKRCQLHFVIRFQDGSGRFVFTRSLAVNCYSKI
jgi:hypothetical protein